MIYDFFYGIPQWAACLVIIAGILTVSFAGLAATQRLFPHEMRARDQDAIGIAGATIGVVYAVLLAFIAVAVWEAYGKADDTAAKEASLAGDIFRDSQLLPPVTGEALRSRVAAYVDHAIEVEWPAMAEGKVPDRHGWEILEEIPPILGLAEWSPLQAVVAQEVFNRLNSLYDARRDRIAMASSGLQAVTWFVMLVGSMVSLGFCWLLGFESRILHQAVVGLTSVMLALVLFLIIMFDYPFRGEVQIGPDAFVTVQNNIKAIEAHRPMGRTGT